MRVGKITSLFKKPEAIGQRRPELIGITRINALLAKHLHIAQKHCRDVIPVAEPFWGQLHRESEEPIVTITSGIGTHNQRAGPTQISEPDRRCIGHLGGKDISEVLTGLCIVEIAVVIDDEVETEFPCVVLRDVAHPLGACLGKVDGSGGYWSLNLLIGDRSEMLLRQRAHCIQGQVADQRSLHQICAVVLLKKRDRRSVQAALGLVSQRGEVANLKAIRGMITQKLAREPIGNAEILFTAHGPLCIDRVLLLVDVGWVQQRISEETGEPIQRFGKGVVFHQHHVIGNVQAGVSIGHTTMLRGKRHEPIWLWELAGPHKKHVLEIVRHPGIVLWIRGSTQPHA